MEPSASGTNPSSHFGKRIKTALLLIAAFLFFGVLSAATQASNSSGTSDVSPSFDCAKASSLVENAICSDATLARLDSEMAEKYGRLRTSGISETSRNDLIQGQRNWLRRRNACSEKSCLEQAYRDRIAQICEQASGSSGNFTCSAEVSANPESNIMGPTTALAQDSQPSMAETEPPPTENSGQHAEKWQHPRTGLLWEMSDNGADINWKNAGDWCRSKGMRLPTADEFLTLYGQPDSGTVCGRYLCDIPKAFRVSSFWVWTSTLINDEYAGFFDLRTRSSDGVPAVAAFGNRALCVTDR